jgi:hypothetical protein
MKIHLIRTEDFPKAQYHEVLQFLQGQVGILQFIEGPVVTLNPNYDYHIFEEEEFVKQKFDVRKHKGIHKGFIDDEKSSDSGVFFSYSPPTFPMRQRTYEWSQFFKTCKAYREFNDIPAQDLVFLLTNAMNKKNWFGSIDESMRNFFVHTADWPFFFKMLNKPIYPIAYEIVVWILRSMMFTHREEILDHVHDQPLGCINDFCVQKDQIILKMRTGDICLDCMDQIVKNDVPPPILRQIQNTLNDIRQHILFSRTKNVYLMDSPLLVSKQQKTLQFPDYSPTKARLNPKELSLYLLYLNHPEGIALNCVTDHQEELLSYYKDVSGQVDLQRMSTTVSLLSSYNEQELSVTLSRIRKKIKNAIGTEFSKKYLIDPLPNGTHGILISRERVRIADGDPSNGLENF